MWRVNGAARVPGGNPLSTTAPGVFSPGTARPKSVMRARPWPPIITLPGLRLGPCRDLEERRPTDPPRKGEALTTIRRPIDEGVRRALTDTPVVLLACGEGGVLFLVQGVSSCAVSAESSEP